MTTSIGADATISSMQMRLLSREPTGSLASASISSACATSIFVDTCDCAGGDDGSACGSLVGCGKASGDWSAGGVVVAGGAGLADGGGGSAIVASWPSAGSVIDP